jgi:hypothetical protein
MGTDWGSSDHVCPSRIGPSANLTHHRTVIQLAPFVRVLPGYYDYFASVIWPPENAPEQEFVPEYVPVILAPLPSIWSVH